MINKDRITKYPHGRVILFIKFVKKSLELGIINIKISKNNNKIIQYSTPLFLNFRKSNNTGSNAKYNHQISVNSLP
jgi:hypothetical protein